MDILKYLSEKQEKYTRELAVNQAVLRIKKDDLDRTKASLLACISDRDKIKSEEQSLEEKIRQLDVDIDNKKQSINESTHLIDSLKRELSGIFVLSFGRKKEIKSQIENTESTIFQENKILNNLNSERSKLERERKTGLLESVENRILEKQDLVTSLEKEILEIKHDIERKNDRLSEICMLIQNQKEELRKTEEMQPAEKTQEVDILSGLKSKEKEEIPVVAEIINEKQEEGSIVSESAEDKSEEISKADGIQNGVEIQGDTVIKDVQPTVVEDIVVDSDNVDRELVEKNCNSNSEEFKIRTLSLYRAILLLNSEEECWNFFGELVGSKEYAKLEQRAQLAKLLDSNATYTEVHQMTGASTATISRVNAVLNRYDEFRGVIINNRASGEKPAREYLGNLIMTLKSEESCKYFFSCLCSPTECQAMELRFSIATLIYMGDTYVQVSAKTGASSATIGRVKSVIDNEYSFIRQVLKRAEKSDNIVSDENTIIETNSVIPIKDASKSTKLEKQLIYYKLTDVDAVGYEEDGLGFVLKKGSKVCVKERVSCSMATKRMRRQYSELISENGILKEDIILKSVHEATNFCAFGTANSTLVWKDKNGTTLRDIRKTEEVRQAEEARKEEVRLSEETRKAEEVRQAEEARKAEARQAEEARKAEEARQAEEARKAEEARQAEEARKAEARQAEEARKAEEARQAEEARKVEEARQADETIETEKTILDESQEDIPQESYENIDIELIGLSVRSYHCLKRENISSVGQMMFLTEEDLHSIRNMGQKSIDEILSIQGKIKKGRINSIVEGGINFDESDLDNKIPSTMLEKATPSLIGKKVSAIYYKDRFGVWQSDCLLEELGLTSRTMNCLRRASFSNISEVAFARYDEISGIKNMGKKSIDELLKYLGTSVKCHIEKDEAFEKVETLYGQIMAVLQQDYPEFDFGRYEQVIKSCLAELVDDKDRLTDKMPELLMHIFNSEQVMSEVEKDIVDDIKASSKAMSKEEIFKKFPLAFKEYGMDIKILGVLEQKKIIERHNKRYRIRLPYLQEWIETLPESERKAIKLRLEGKTLQEAGKMLNNLTRERVRQLVDRGYKGKPQLREDDLGYWYSKYNYDEEALTYIFEVDEIIVNYLNTVYKNKKGTDDIEQMLDDPNLDATLYKRAHAYIYRNSVLIGSKYVPCKRSLLCREIAKQVCSDNDIKLQDLYNEYMRVLDENNLQYDDKLLFPSERAFEARMQDSMYLLMKYRRRLRYYAIAEYDVAELIKKLHLERFKDVEISTLKLFRENPELMDEFDIRDEYELHNLLKKTENIWNSEKYVSVNRMPNLVFGNADKKKQAEGLMYQLAPVSLEEFCEAYEMEYGVLRQTATSGVVPLISKYLHDRTLTVDQSSLTDDEKKHLADIMVDDFYFTEDIKKLFVSKFGESNADHLNPRTLKEQGYKVYCSYLINNKFPSSADYFSKMIIQNPKFDISLLDRRIIYIQQFNASLESLRNNFDIIEYEDGKYITFSHFSSVLPEYDKTTLLSYVTETLKYAEGLGYFTIKYLTQDGYDHPLHHIGFGEWFAGALIKNSKRISFLRVGGTILFYEGKTKRTKVDFLCHVLSKYKALDIYVLVDVLKEDYGISMSKDKIILIIKESELYYDSTMEKVYLNKEYFYDEL